MPVDGRMRAQNQLILDKATRVPRRTPPPTGGTRSTTSTISTASTRSWPAPDADRVAEALGGSSTRWDTETFRRVTHGRFGASRSAAGSSA